MSTPAVKDTAAYAHRIRDEYGKDVVFDIFYLCGEREAGNFDTEAAEEAILGCDFMLADLMGADGFIMDRLTPAFDKTKCQRVVVSALGPVTQKLGRYDEKRFRTDKRDLANIKRVADYWRECDDGDIESAFNLILREYFGMTDLPEPLPLSSREGAYLKNPLTGKVFETREGYLAEYPRDPSRQDIALFFQNNSYPTYTLPAVREMFSALSGFCNVMPVSFNRVGPEHVPAIERLIGDVDLAIDVIAFRFIAGPMGGDSSAAMAMLRKLDVPFVRPFFLGRSFREEWEERTSGLTVMEFMLNVFMAELDGAVCTFPIAVNEETETLEEYGITLSEVTMVPDRLDRLCGKVKGLLRLRRTPNREKRVAIVGYNYPPGEGNLFGGAFLDTFGSISAILRHMESAGYDTEAVPKEDLVREFLEDGLMNRCDWASRDMDRLIKFGGSTEHPREVCESWGPAPGDVLADRDGYIIPGTVKGNVFIGIQPPRSLAEGEEASKEYHDPYKPPHHQYLAFYEWIRDEFKADAVVHIGTHGTVEFLPGKEVGMSGGCYPDMTIGDIPHFYLYYMGNPSEAVIAKRRSHAALVSYMGPPYTESGLYGDLAELEGLIAEYRESRFVDEGRSRNVSDTIVAKAEEMRLPTDLDDLEHELEDMRVSLIPRGFHTIGTGFTEEEAETFAIQSMRFPHEGCREIADIFEDVGAEVPEPDVIAGIYRAYNRYGTVPEGFGDDADMLTNLEFEKRLAVGGTRCHEIEMLLGSLDGRYIPAKAGDDFLRNPETIPTGYNIVQFDPRKVPTRTAFDRGAEAAGNTISMHMAEEGRPPESVAMVMWGIETSRSQGTSLGQMLTYLGIRMVSEGGDFEDRFEIIPIEELGRPRIDVTATICGFFRDMFSNVLDGLNRLFMMLWETGESDEESYFNMHTRRNLEHLLAEGYSPDDALDLAVCRVFGPKEGLYGTGMTDFVNSSNWEEETDLSDVFEESMRHAYSLRHRGKDTGRLLSENFSRVDVVSQVRQNVEYELIDLDHYYEFFGGLSKTVEVARGSKARMYITDNTGPEVRTTTVKASIEHGVRTRLLNPRWIDSMLETDYHGTQHINDRFENVLGLAATTGAVDSGVFSDMERCYVEDRDLRRRLMENNNYAYIQMLNRLYEAHGRGYWSATEEELDTLREAFEESEELAEESSDRS